MQGVTVFEICVLALDGLPHGLAQERLEMGEAETETGGLAGGAEVGGGKERGGAGGDGEEENESNENADGGF